MGTFVLNDSSQTVKSVHDLEFQNKNTTHNFIWSILFMEEKTNEQTDTVRPPQQTSCLHIELHVSHLHNTVENH